MAKHTANSNNEKFEFLFSENLSASEGNNKGNVHKGSQNFYSHFPPFQKICKASTSKFLPKCGHPLCTLPKWTSSIHFIKKHANTHNISLVFTSSINCLPLFFRRALWEYDLMGDNFMLQWINLHFL